ncbi:hypothetical protein CANARDRAFT_80728 [[Candida] arabinofermentans NRRL YB-2248]|uniref:Mediator of RNA polymerase II transcription subunit 12 n=1 Tax=[Candida] arabinofermentans NRRL YB-2248 TaxID=983967 RepID=A0A1E4SVE0_9ASCO|nr:hypothetical protein CANARDRAFT_80728 [[Candida] arabinofermentans NRRL YB-2248]
MNNQKVVALPGQIPRPEGVYPLNGEDPNSAGLGGSGSVGTGNSLNSSKGLNGSGNYTYQSNMLLNHTNVEPIYPDFKVWKHTSKDDALMRSHLQKGFFETSCVSNESHSGRQIVTQLLNRPSSSSTNGNSLNGGTPANEAVENTIKTKLNNLSEVMVKTILRRRELNKIKTKSTYKPPPRVTLTDHKREMWLKNLADPNIPLKQLSRAVPHGLRNRVLLEQCVNHKIPIHRAIWLIRCVSTNEQRQLKRKLQSSTASQSVTVGKWIVEWTEQVTLFIEQIISNCFVPANRSTWRYKLNYFIELSGNLYLQNLMNRETFLSWIVHYAGRLIHKDCTDLQGFKTLSVHYLFIKLFWFKIINVDYLSKELNENMLLAIAKLQEIPKVAKYEPLVNNLSSLFQTLIRYLFYYNSDTFIIPSCWSQLKGHLKKIIDMSNAQVSEQFKLITYRNESLMIDETGKSGLNASSGVEYNRTLTLVHQLNNMSKSTNLKDLVKLIFVDSSSEDNSLEHSDWKQLLKLLLKWTVTIYREESKDAQKIACTRSILKIRIHELSRLKSKKFKLVKQELELEIMGFVYEMAELLNFGNDNNAFNLVQVLRLTNELYSLDLFSVPSYLRRLIASGVIYLQDADKSCYIHLLILNSLPGLQDSNSRNILKRLSDSTNILLPDKNDHLAKERLRKLLDYVFQQSQEFDLYELNDILQYKDDVDPLELGKRVAIEAWFLNEFKEYLRNFSYSFSITHGNLTILNMIFSYKFNMAPQFIGLIVRHLDKTSSTIDQTALTFLLKVISYNDELLLSCISDDVLSGHQNSSPTSQSQLQQIDITSNMFHDIYCILMKWCNSNKFDITHVFELAKFNKYLIPVSLKDETAKYMERKKIINKPQKSAISLEELNQLGISSYERLTNAAEYSHHLSQTINQYWNSIKGFNTDSQSSVISLLKILQNWKPEDFSTTLLLHLRKLILPTLSLEYDLSLKFVLKLVVEGFIDLQSVIQILGKNKSKDEFSTDCNEKLIWDLLFSNTNESILSDFELFSLSFEKKVYRRENPEEYFNFLSVIFREPATPMEETQSSAHDVDIVHVGVDDVVSADVMNSLHDLSNVSVAQTPPGNAVTGVDSNIGHHHHHQIINKEESKINKFNDLVIDSIWYLTFTHMDLFVELFYKNDLNKPEIKELFTVMLDIKASDADGWIYDDLIRNLNYFNLPVSQLLFKILIEEEVSNITDDYELSAKVTQIILQILNQLKGKYNDFHLIGELFEFLDDKLKLKILYACEEIYFGSETFPKLTVNGQNLTNFLIDILTSCSRLKDHNHSVIPLSDSLVFSLNLSLERLMYFSSSLDHKKNKSELVRDLETSIMLLSRIILVHKNFLVELILKRSVNFQRDVFLINLTKLFNHRVMDKRYKLKNLLYDILISLKILISETLSQNVAPTQNFNSVPQGYSQQYSVTTPQQAALITSLSINKGTPSSTSYQSPPGHSPMPPPGSGMTTNAASASLLSSSSNGGFMSGNGGLMNVTPPNYNNKLKFMLQSPTFDHLKDTLIENEKKYFLIDSGTTTGIGPGTGNMIRFNLKSFELIEDSSTTVGLNDSCISLQYFDACIEKKNPR